MKGEDWEVGLAWCGIGVAVREKFMEITAAEI
jgi:hypothetical protein